jgi:predicted nuclease with TOPRIM domain
LGEQQSAGEALSAEAAADRDSDRSMITAVELEVADLRDQLEAQANAAKKSADTNKEDLSELNEKLEQSQAEIQKLTKDNDDLNELGEKLEQSQAENQKLTELAKTWKRKYKFLSTDAPEAYQTQAAAEK